MVAGAEGGVALESGYRLEYALQDLGLDSRSATIEGGKQGAYEFGLSYDRVPHTISDTGETIFSGIGSRDLTLPGDWVRAGSTGDMTALGTSLRSVEEGYDRDRYGLFGRFFARPELVGRARLQARRAQRHAAQVRVVRQHCDGTAAPRRRFDRPLQRIGAVPGHELVRAGGLLRLDLRLTGRIVPLREPVHRPRRQRGGLAGARARQQLQRVRAVRGLVRPARQHRRHGLRRDGAGHAGRGLRRLHAEPEHRDRRTAVREPRRRRQRHARRPDR